MKVQRGPHKGDGGRPAKPLREDFPGNQVVATALWLLKGKKHVLPVPLIEMLIYLFDGGDFVVSPDDGIGSITTRDGVPMVMISALKNTRADRASGANYPDGSRRQTPDGRTLMRDRVQLIRAKIKKHTPRKLAPKGYVWLGPTPTITKDQLWLDACWAGLDLLLAGQKEQAMVAFNHAGWPLDGPAMDRLNQFLNMRTEVNKKPISAPA